MLLIWLSLPGAATAVELFSGCSSVFVAVYCVHWQPDQLCYFSYCCIICSVVLLQNGANLFGISDETRTLKYDKGNGLPEVAVRISIKKSSKFFCDSLSRHNKQWKEQNNYYKLHVKGPVVISKCPVVHPGDVQMFWAV